MTDDEILSVATEVARKRHVLADPRWEALAHGTLGEADRAELEALAQRSDEARRALDLHRPLDALEEEELIERALARASKQTPDPASPSPSPTPVIPQRPRRLGLAAFVSLASVAAAVVLFLQVDRGGVTPGPLPSYSSPAITGEQLQRGVASPDVPEHVFGPGSEVELVLRPDVPARGPIAAHTFLGRGGHVAAWGAPIEVSTDGSVRIAGSYETIFRGVPPGPVDLVIAVGRPGRVPSTPAGVDEAMAGSSAAADGSWRLLRVRVRLVDRGSP
jgi:hypothetical protein